MIFAEAAVDDEEGAGGGNCGAGMSGYGDEGLGISVVVVVAIVVGLVCCGGARSGLCGASGC